MPVRFDEPRLDLVDHARAVIRGEVDLEPAARAEMISIVGVEPDKNASDAVVARAYLAACGLT